MLSLFVEQHLGLNITRIHITKRLRRHKPLEHRIRVHRLGKFLQLVNPDCETGLLPREVFKELRFTHPGDIPELLPEIIRRPLNDLTDTEPGNDLFLRGGGINENNLAGTVAEDLLAELVLLGPVQNCPDVFGFNGKQNACQFRSSPISTSIFHLSPLKYLVVGLQGYHFRANPYKTQAAGSENDA